MGRRLSAGLATLLGLVAALPAAAGSGDLSVVVAAASDYVSRGVSYSDGGPALQLGLSYQHTSGFFAGLWGSTIDFPGHDPRSAAGDVEVDAFVGYGADLGPRLSLVASVLRYEYPGADGGAEYDSTELGLAVALDDLLRAAVTYSDDVLGSGSEGTTYELVATRDVSRLTVGAGLGYFDLGDLGGYAYAYAYPHGDVEGVGGAGVSFSYTYWHVSVGTEWRRLGVELGYYDTAGDAERLWGDLAEGRLVASVSWRLR